MFPTKRSTVRLGSILTVPEQVQTLCSSGKTGRLVHLILPQPASLQLFEGEVVDARMGRASGLEAALELINRGDSETEFFVDQPPEERTIQLPYMQLLCEAARLKDEMTQTRSLMLETPQHHTLQLMLNDEPCRYPLRMGMNRIGRRLDNEIVIPDGSVSQHHALIEVTPGGAYLRDCGSMNGTYASGQKMGRKWLVDQEPISFGSVRGTYTDGYLSSKSLR